jgi:hypothetical protein
MSRDQLLGRIFEVPRVNVKAGWLKARGHVTRTAIDVSATERQGKAFAWMSDERSVVINHGSSE